MPWASANGSGAAMGPLFVGLAVIRTKEGAGSQIESRDAGLSPRTLAEPASDDIMPSGRLLGDAVIAKKDVLVPHWGQWLSTFQATGDKPLVLFGVGVCMPDVGRGPGSKRQKRGYGCYTRVVS